jgi:hypothetical protein
MRYTSDYKYEKAKDLIDSLDVGVEEYDLILYYINKKDERIKNLESSINEYRECFKQMDRFLPNKNPIFK